LAATIDDVRAQIGDTDPDNYIFGDPEIQSALDEAQAIIEAEGGNVSSILGKRAQKLLAAAFLVDMKTGNIKERNVKTIREGDASLDFEDLSAKAKEWRAEAERLIDKLRPLPFGVTNDFFSE
jgi:hypothetical protein